PAAPVAALAAVTVGDHLHVAELPRDAEAAPQHLPVDEQSPANARAEGDHDQVALPSSRPEAPLGSGGGVGIVVDEDGLRDALPQSVAQRLVAPGQVGGEDNSRAVGSDEAGGSDTDREDL